MVLALATAALVVAGCTSSTRNEAAPNNNSTAQKGEKVVQYTCPMHTDVVQDKPGNCPKCGMKLVEKK